MGNSPAASGSRRLRDGDDDDDGGACAEAATGSVADRYGGGRWAVAKGRRRRVQLLEEDPRSPTEGIDRTPIGVLAGGGGGCVTPLGTSGQLPFVGQRWRGRANLSACPASQTPNFAGPFTVPDELPSIDDDVDGEEGSADAGGPTSFGGGGEPSTSAVATDESAATAAGGLTSLECSAQSDTGLMVKPTNRKPRLARLRASFRGLLSRATASPATPSPSSVWRGDGEGEGEAALASAPPAIGRHREQQRRRRRPPALSWRRGGRRRRRLQEGEGDGEGEDA